MTDKPGEDGTLLDVAAVDDVDDVADSDDSAEDEDEYESILIEQFEREAEEKTPALVSGGHSLIESGDFTPQEYVQALILECDESPSDYVFLDGVVGGPYSFDFHSRQAHFEHLVRLVSYAEGAGELLIDEFGYHSSLANSSG